MNQPRQIYASAADRRSGRRWSRRHRPIWIPVAVLGLAVLIAETLRSLA